MRSAILGECYGARTLKQSRFRDDDIYGRDEKLAELLAVAGASEPATGPTADTGCHGAIVGLASLNP